MKRYAYVREQDPGLDAEFAAAETFGRTRLGAASLFWKNGLKWYTIPLDQVERIYRRVEFVYGKLCLGGSSYDIQRLMLVLKTGENVEIPVGDRMEKRAVALMQALRNAHPEIQYGKP